MKRGVILVLFTALISGSAIFINQFGVKGIDSTVFTFTKNIAVAMFLLAIIMGFKEYRSISARDWLSLLLIGLIGGSIPFILFFKGLQMSSGAAGSFIHKTMFIFVAVIAMIFLKERLSKKIIIPASILLIGNYLLLNAGSFELGLGSLFVFIATLFWAVENVISKKALERIEPKTLAFGRMFFGSLFILIYMAFTSKVSLLGKIGLNELGWIAISAVFLLLYVITWYTGLRDVKVTTAT